MARALVIGAVFFFSVLAGEYAWLKYQVETAPIQYQDGIAIPKEKAAMKYHGIRFAETLPDGTLVFYRGGQQCRLFTKEFLRVWER